MEFASRVGVENVGVKIIIEPVKTNKEFKSDSQRLAFFILSLGFVFMVVWLGFVVALLTP